MSATAAGRATAAAARARCQLGTILLMSINDLGLLPKYIFFAREHTVPQRERDRSAVTRLYVVIDSLRNKSTPPPRLKHLTLGTDAVRRLACPRLHPASPCVLELPCLRSSPTKLARETCMTSIIVHGAASYADRKEREPQTGETDGTITT